MNVKSTRAIGVLDPALTDMELWDVEIRDDTDKLEVIQTLACRLVSDGLSRRLSSRAFDMVFVPSLRTWLLVGIPRAPDYGAKLVRDNPGKNADNMSDVVLTSHPSLVVQRMNITVEGLGYQASTTTGYQATVVAVIYLIVGFTHVS